MTQVVMQRLVLDDCGFQGIDQDAPHRCREGDEFLLIDQEPTRAVGHGEQIVTQAHKVHTDSSKGQVPAISRTTTLRGSAIARCGSKRTSSERGVPIRCFARKYLEKKTEISRAVCQIRSGHPTVFHIKNCWLWLRIAETLKALKSAEKEDFGYVAVTRSKNSSAKYF